MGEWLSKKTGWLKTKLMALVTFINAAIGITLGGLLYTFWPDLYFNWYPSIPVFFWLTGIVMIYVLDRVKRENGDVTVTMFMLIRFCRFTLALIFLGLYIVLVNSNMQTFGSTLMLFYLIHLGLETYTVYLFEKKRMKREKKERDERYQKK